MFVRDARIMMGSLSLSLKRAPPPIYYRSSPPPPAPSPRRPYLTGDFLLDAPPVTASRAVANLFGVGTASGMLGSPVIDYGRYGGGDAGVEPIAGGAGDGGQPSFGALPEAMQEQLLLDDLLSALMGFAGRWVFWWGER